MELGRINEAKTYLEIGVANGKTFLNVDFPHEARGGSEIPLRRA